MQNSGVALNQKDCCNNVEAVSNESGSVNALKNFSRSIPDTRFDFGTELPTFAWDEVKLLLADALVANPDETIGGCNECNVNRAADSICLCRCCLAQCL
jgi:hypothetical protein